MLEKSETNLSPNGLLILVSNELLSTTAFYHITGKTYLVLHVDDEHIIGKEN